MRLRALLSLLLLPSIAQAATFGRTSNAKVAGYPVILVPGYAGSQLEANLTGKPSTVHYLCSSLTSDYFDLWLDLTNFAPIKIDCWVDNMKMIYNVTDGTTSNMPGVDIRVPGGFSDTDGVEWLDKSKASQGRYFVDIADALVGWGYSRGKDLVGAPFDWRKAPNEQTAYFKQLRATTQSLYNWNKKKVVFIAHSMGNPMLKYFLDNFVDSEWKDTYVRSFVSIAPPWGGSLQIVKLFASGYNMNYYRIILPPSKMRDMQRSFTASALLYPNAAAWDPDYALASAPDKNYTITNIEEFFKDVNYTMGWQQYLKAGPPNLSFEAPDVETHCAYGTGVDTPEHFDWRKGYFPDYPPEILNGDGDGTVNRRSAEVCNKWAANRKKSGLFGKIHGPQITSESFVKTDHMEILKHPGVIEIVRKAVYDEF